MLKIIKEDQFRWYKLYLTLPEVESLHLENCKMGQKARSYYRIMKEITNRKKIWLAGDIQSTFFVVRRNKSKIQSPESAWCLGNGWLDILCFWWSTAFTGTQKLPKFQFTDVTTWAGVAPFWVRNLSQR